MSIDVKIAMRKIKEFCAEQDETCIGCPMYDGDECFVNCELPANWQLEEIKF